MSFPWPWRKAPLLNPQEGGRPESKQALPAGRRWRFWQVETSLACQLDCLMCPWKKVRQGAAHKGLMTAGVWEALQKHLPEVAAVDLSGGGEPLMHPFLLTWLAQAKKAGCRAGFLTSGLLLDEKKAGGLLEAQADWVAFSLDGATKEVYEGIRVGADFALLIKNIKRLSALRRGGPPWIILQTVMMPQNIGQLEAVVDLAAELGADQVNFKQCDVLRESTPQGLSLFTAPEGKAIKAHQKNLNRARRKAGRLGIKTTAFSFRPDELPACDMDPAGSLFVAHDGRVCPCINLAYGGDSRFLGQEVRMPEVCYGRLPEQDVGEIWERSEDCLFYRRRFAQRVKAYNAALNLGELGEPSLYKLEQALKKARAALPAAPPGCAVCHYLYDI